MRLEVLKYVYCLTEVVTWRANVQGMSICVKSLSESREAQGVESGPVTTQLLARS